MTTGKIAAMGYVAIRTPRLDEAVRSAADIFGLRAVDLSATKAYLAAAQTHHELVYIKDDEPAVDHIGVVAQSSADLAAIRESVREGGWAIVSEHPLEDHIEEGFAFAGPEGFTWHVYYGMSNLTIPDGGFGPERYGHVNIWVKDTVAMRDFLIDTFGFQVSDQVGEDLGFFLRCNPEHHGVAILKSPDGQTGLHHHAWQTPSIVEMAHLADRLAKAGSRLIWGPIRHGAGKNLAVYYIEPTGNIVELYSEMEHIYDPTRGVLRWAADDPNVANMWTDHYPAPDGRNLLLTPTPR